MYEDRRAEQELFSNSPSPYLCVRAQLCIRQPLNPGRMLRTGSILFGLPYDVMAILADKVAAWRMLILQF